MSTTAPVNLDSAKLKAVNSFGLVKESILDKIWDWGKVPLAFTDLVGSGTHDNERHDWTTDELALPNIANAFVDGADLTQDDTKLGERVCNHSQISTKRVSISERADASNTIGRAKETAYQVSRRLQELKRDVNAILLTGQASFADTGAVAGKVGALGSWLKTNYVGGTGGAAGGFDHATKLTKAPTPSTAVNTLSEKALLGILQNIYQGGGEASTLLVHPGVMAAFSAWFIKNKGNTANIMTEQSPTESATALGSVSVFWTDFGPLKVKAERLMPTTTIGGKTCAPAYVLTPDNLSISYLRPYHMDDQAKTGLSTSKQMSVDYTLVVGNEKSCGVIADIDISAAMVA